MSSEREARALSRALAEQLRHVGERSEHWADATAMLLVDAIVLEEPQPLEDFLSLARSHPARSEGQVELETLASVAHWGIARLLPVARARRIDWGACEGRILDYLWEHPDSTSKSLYTQLDVAQETISRVGSALEADSLVRRRRVGKWLKWNLTPQGRKAVAIHRGAATREPTAKQHVPASPRQRDLLDELLEPQNRSVVEIS